MAYELKMSNEEFNKHLDRFYNDGYKAGFNDGMQTAFNIILRYCNNAASDILRTREYNDTDLAKAIREYEFSKMIEEEEKWDEA